MISPSLDCTQNVCGDSAPGRPPMWSRDCDQSTAAVRQSPGLTWTQIRTKEGFVRYLLTLSVADNPKERSMRVSTKGHVREALMRAALFGSAALFGTMGAAVGQTPAPNADRDTAAQPASKSDQNGAQEPSAKSAAPTAQGPEIFANGTLTVPGATETSTTPAKFSQQNNALDHSPIMARGPALTDAQRKLILGSVKAGSAASSRVATGPAMALPLGDEMQAWPQDIVSQVPELRDTKYVSLADKILVVQPNSRIVVEEIPR
jgi:hypothetical protein